MSSQDTIFIHQLKIRTKIGVHKWERQIDQLVLIDIEMQTNLEQAIATDNLANTLDYQNVSEKIISFVKSKSFNLIESLAAAIADMLLVNPILANLKITVTKPAALPNASCVGVTIARTK